MTQPDQMPQRRHSRAIRAGAAMALAVLLLAPPVAAPLGAPPRLLAADVAAATEGDPGPPSVHYLQALEHAADVLEFEPGERVTVPFRPRAGDAWEIDGRAPRALPAGHATGLQMRSAPANAVWAAGPPADLAIPDHAAKPGGANDDGTQGTGTVEPAAYTGSAGQDGLTTAAPVGPSGLRREVFGFLPYWEIGDSSTTLDWKTLSTVAYFSVGCTSSGGLDKQNADGSTSTGWAGWTSSKMTSIINTAHEHQARVVLTISCFAWTSGGAARQKAVLGSSTARSTLARAAAAAVRDRGADGINLDFEPIVAGYADEFTALVRSVRSELNKIAPGYQLTFDTLGSIGNQPIVEATAPGGADAVFIMGYDYRTDSSSVAGSISPLSGPRYDLTDTVKAYTAKISPSKVILGVPYYGRAWSTASDSLNASTLSPAKYGAPATPTYSQLLDLVGQHGRRYDSVEQTPWTAYRKETCTSAYGCVTSWRQLYYDDAASLRLRYDLVNRTSLRGAGIWALGYDGTRPELRQALADKFLSDRTPPVVGVTTLAETQRDEGFRVGWSSWDDSTITGYDVQVSVEGGAWTSWLTGTTRTSAIFLGTNGRRYAFRIRATDAHGNVSAWNTATSTSAIDVPSALAVGGFGSVEIDGLRMRSSPTTSASILATLALGDALQVIGGPASADGYTWYQVAGPVKQWAPVDPIQVGGWVAVASGSTTYVAPRRPVYATKITAAISNLKLNGGGNRVLTPNGDGLNDKLHLTWANHVSLDSIALRVYRTDGTLVGSVGLGGTGSGSHAWDWNGRIDGSVVPAGDYVIQLQGVKGSATFSTPSASPVSPEQIARFGVVVGPAAPTELLAFQRPISPNRAYSLTWRLTFGGPIGALSAGDFARTGTATGCKVGAPVGSGATWSVTLTGCSTGTVTLGLKPRTVVDAVRNWGPATQVDAAQLLIDRTAPVARAPRVALAADVYLPSTSTRAALPAVLKLAATDSGGAGVAGYDVQRSTDGGAWRTIATARTSSTLAVAMTPGHSYRYRVRARDRAGNVGGWVAGPTIRAYLPQNTSTAITWKGAWRTVADPRFSGGSVRYSTAALASVRYSFYGRAIAWVTTLAPTRGLAKVYVDGSLVATIDLSTAATTFGRVVFARTWSSRGYHTIRIVVVGTAGRPRVDVDAFAVLR